MTIMGLPSGFELLDAGDKTYNHICQNVPVITATDIITEIKESLEGNREWVDANLAIQHNHNGKYDIIERRDTPALLETFF
jgi:hypothetical protein